jgi:hypothetical protein
MSQVAMEIDIWKFKYIYVKQTNDFRQTVVNIN